MKHRSGIILLGFMLWLLFPAIVQASEVCSSAGRHSYIAVYSSGSSVSLPYSIGATGTIQNIGSKNFVGSAASRYTGAAVSTLPAYRTYQSEIYEPFTTETPSMGTLRRGGRVPDDEDDGPSTGGNAGDPGQQSDQSPVGSEWVLLLFAVVWFFRKYRKHIPTLKIFERQ